eukprot:CAMPEP_0115194420 /NCGR_PEP_ID=MMETSP0270-20121206/14062_1 /TAXON_ID=71861 /ORGANISM="Scrippsiella trochoidea, Strain CCMP3099" /LENGTH=108 /DNA_ID=CAMNT_0002607723 /DNA_START=288 /DNA_END=611 /DNA_ORIENTATION=+
MRERLNALTRSWGFQNLLQLSNFLYNGIYIAATLTTQISEIQDGDTWGATPKEFVVYGILVLSLVGANTLAVGFDGKFRLSLAVKNAMLWLKVILLRWLAAKPYTSWN